MCCMCCMCCVRECTRVRCLLSNRLIAGGWTILAAATALAEERGKHGEAV